MALKLILVALFVLALLIGVFVITTYFQSFSASVSQKYDNHVDCDSVHQMYDADSMAEIAAQEWRDYYTVNMNSKKAVNK